MDEPPGESVRRTPDSEAGKSVESRLFVHHKISVSRRDSIGPPQRLKSAGAASHPLQ